MPSKGKYTPYIVIGVIVLVLIIIIGWYVSARNKFVTLDEELSQKWAAVEVQYQRRLDLIPNIVASVAGAADIETSSMENVVKARTAGENLMQAVDAAKKVDGSQAGNDEQVMTKFANAQQSVDRALSLYVNAVHEAYPNYKSIEQFKDLDAVIEGTESRIAKARKDYTEAVKDYNIAIRKFPGSIVASMSGFAVKPQFQADPEAADAPKITPNDFKTK